MKNKKMVLAFGALSLPIEEQLFNQGIPIPKDIDFLEKCSKAITLLRIKGLITDSEADNASKRLMNKINLAIAEAKP